MANLFFVAGDNASSLTVTCQDENQNIINLTGCTVQLIIKTNVNAAATKTMTVLSPASNGQAQYVFQSSDLTPGQMRFQVRITFSSGLIVTSQEQNIPVERVLT